MSAKLKVLIVLCIGTLPTILFAQAPPDFDEQVYDVAVPFDPGITILAAIGIAYGLMKIIQHNKREKIRKQLS